MPEIGEVMPGTNEKIVGKVYNPKGTGYWLQGENGGVFAMEGAPYLGGYFDPELAEHRNDPNRRFSGIELTGSGGYRSLTAGGGGTGYAFDPRTQAATTGGGATATTPAALTPAQERAAAPGAGDAKSELVTTLARYGLPASLADQLWDNEYIQKGTPINTIINLKLPETNEYKQRFPGLTMLQERRNRGEAVLIPSVTEYLQLENGIAGVMRDAGLPPGAFDEPSELAKFIGGSVSPKEVEDRIVSAKNLLYNSPVETREELNRVYGLDEGEAVAYILNPEIGMREVNKRVLGAGVGGASRRVGFGLLTQQEMEQLAGSGVTESGAGQAFGELAQIGAGLFAETIEEAGMGEDLNRQTQIGFVQEGGRGAEAQRMQTRRQRRAASFQGGGGAAAGGEGRTGLG